MPAENQSKSSDHTGKDRHIHLFFSYSRKDNQPKHPGGEGWVTAFERELRQRHQHYSGRGLRVFFDTKDIEVGRDWKRELGVGLRASRLFLAFLSPNYIISPNCLWEWEEYLRREHSAARGDDGITPIFFVTPDDLSPADDQRLAAWLTAMQHRYPWFVFAAEKFGDQDEKRIRPWLADLNRRNRTHNCELQPWFERGPEILRELDAAERAAAIRAAPRAPGDDLRTLAERLDALDRRAQSRWLGKDGAGPAICPRLCRVLRGGRHLGDWLRRRVDAWSGVAQAGGRSAT